ncbi:ead/Ea22-like family protein [Escherichia coli]|nr:ead/Ea22-like family protein [Escherichia coli]EJI5952329.1 ead/Ea22-like family protein [Escherichia coli]EJY0664852.1 ead/Ea22-like family protein [Escherichia coli]EKH9562980.1 ead/Ea22-like family protein [Escherichia coli]EKZ7878545.1 ead/Ea22-like family protein [Escherichia coli]
MNKIDYQALREAAEKAGEDKWQAKKINGDFFVIRHGSYTRQHGYTSYQPIAEIDCKPVRDFVAKANPATVLELLDELEAAENNLIDSESHIAELEEALRDKQALLEASEKRIAELESDSQAQKLVEAIIVAIENEQERLFDEDYLMDSKECIDVIREEVKRWNDSRAAGIRIKGE